MTEYELGCSISDINLKLSSLNEQQINEFITELTDIHLISTEKNPAPKAISDTHLEVPKPGKYESDSYVEPVAGGDNLQEEFDFQDWALSNDFLWSSSCHAAPELYCLNKI